MTKSNYNISKFDHCYGCGVCVLACPTKIISLRQNEVGFFQPIIEELDSCIKCGLCLKTCAYNHDEVLISSYEPQGFSGWSNNKEFRSHSTSGGISTEICKQFVGEYIICGVVYNADLQRAEHRTSDDAFGIDSFTGSKYLQSYTLNGFKDIDLNQKNIVIGTPCQIDSLRRYIRMRRKEENFILIDIFCHGVPSQLMWIKYLNSFNEKIGPISNASWRNKILPQGLTWCGRSKFNWHDSYNVLLIGENGSIVSPRSGGDLFTKFFLGNYCLNECCYQCKYKRLSSVADIRLGDFWGSRYNSNQDGVNSIIAFTKRGCSLLNALKEVSLFPETLNSVTEGQMVKPAHKPCNYNMFLRALGSDKTLKQIDWGIVKPYELTVLLFKRIKNKLCRIIMK